MPVVIPVVAAAAASYGAGLAIAGTVIAGTFAGSLVVAGAGLAASVATPAFGKPESPQLEVSTFP